MSNKIIELQDKISRIVFEDNRCTCHFDKHDLEHQSRVVVSVTTYNPKTEESFLLKQIVSLTEEESLEQILDYITNHKTEYNSFTVSWSKKGDNSPKENSYFYCKDMYEVLDKFSHGHEKDDYIIWNIKLNPIS